MDIAQIAGGVATFLAPFLPYLLKAGEKAAEEAGKKLGGDAWDKAKTLWARLRPKVESKPAALEAVKDLAESPADEEAKNNLRYNLKKLLTEDPTLAKEVEELMGRSGNVTIATASGDRGVAVSGNVTGSSITTGDANVVGDNNTVSVNKSTNVARGMTLDEFTALLAAMREELRASALDERTRNVVIADVEAVETEAQDARPSLPLIESRLKGIEAIVKRVGGIGSAAAKLLPMVHKAIESAERLFR